MQYTTSIILKNYSQKLRKKPFEALKKNSGKNFVATKLEGGGGKATKKKLQDIKMSPFSK